MSCCKSQNSYKVALYKFHNLCKEFDSIGAATLGDNETVWYWGLAIDNLSNVKESFKCTIRDLP